MFLWLLGWLLRIATALAVALVVWVQLSMGICKSKKKLNGKVWFVYVNHPKWASHIY
jgi:hypothetical protein